MCYECLSEDEFNSLSRAARRSLNAKPPGWYRDDDTEHAIQNSIEEGVRRS